MLTVLFQKVGPDVPLLEHPVTVALGDRLKAKTLHPERQIKENILFKLVCPFEKDTLICMGKY